VETIFSYCALKMGREGRKSRFRIGITPPPSLFRVGKTKEQGRKTQCLGNVKQLQQIWTMYVFDHNDVFAGLQWAGGAMNFSPLNSDNTNVDLLINPNGSFLASNVGGSNHYSGPVQFAYYNKNPAIFRCPSDPAMIDYGIRKVPRIRSYSLNWVLDYGSTRFPRLANLADVVNPGPSEQFAFLDENAITIFEQDFFLDYYLYRFDSLPASYHDGASVISFLDGHCETHRWTDPRTTPVLSPAWMSLTLPPAGEFSDMNGYAGTHTDERGSPDPIWLHSKSYPPEGGW